MKLANKYIEYIFISTEPAEKPHIRKEKVWKLHEEFGRYGNSKRIFFSAGK